MSPEQVTPCSRLRHLLKIANICVYADSWGDATTVSHLVSASKKKHVGHIERCVLVLSNTAACKSSRMAKGWAVIGDNESK